ncbi:voltage-gated calcium channel subunit alpha Cav2.2 [Caerostris extrusa]|uniref:Voltage-gated calcium channel subunit alpha Cav2.2 n=1 Tax=Caerostris extrusa TaxID=172846 RepID=A0AAV4QE78_CAEEX|nr:voltage-gated calcium channel subunit alpha Cav2.2 [Caerostris extrusa]
MIDYPQRPSLLQRLMGVVKPSRQGSLNLDEDQFEDADSHLPLSRQGSVHRSNLSIDKNHNSEDKKWNRSFSFLRRGSSRRKKKKGNDVAGEPTYIQGRDGHLQPAGGPPPRTPSPAFGGRSPMSPPHDRCPTPIHRAPSPRRPHHCDINFTEAASGMIEFVHEKHENKKEEEDLETRDETTALQEAGLQFLSPRGATGRRRIPGVAATVPCTRVSGWIVALGRPAPRPPPHPERILRHLASALPIPEPQPFLRAQPAPGGASAQGAAGGFPHPTKPSTLKLDVLSTDAINFPDVSHSPTVPQPSRSSINFPKLSASPTHHQPWRTAHKAPLEPLSFEAAAAIGRGSRHLPSSPLPNGYKPGQRQMVVRTSRHHDPHEDDWC